MSGARGSIAYTGAESFLVGINPSFWAHLPLSIAQVNNLALIEGIHFTRRHDNEGTFLPVSRCRLMGLIVALDRRSNGSIQFVLDDGTGLIDCFCWSSRDYDALPPLTHDDPGKAQRFSVGDLVRVFGRIECVSFQNIQCQMSKSGRTWEMGAVREIQVSAIELVKAQSRALLYSMDAESDHWSECAKAVNNVRSAPQVLDLLGPSIDAQVSDRRNLPAVDDSGTWRLFGSRCRCQLKYKDRLLYCHCIATPEATDPGFRYRDSLLLTLLEQEASFGDKEPLRFLYNDIVANSHLSMIAQAQLLKGEDSAASSERKLVISTFRALRKDGILYLLDDLSDTYLLLSRSRVLEPYVRYMLEARTVGGNARRLKETKPSYLSKVPKVRLDIVYRQQRI